VLLFNRSGGGVRARHPRGRPRHGALLLVVVVMMTRRLPGLYQPLHVSVQVRFSLQPRFGRHDVTQSVVEIGHKWDAAARLSLSSLLSLRASHDKVAPTLRNGFFDVSSQFFLIGVLQILEQDLQEEQEELSMRSIPGLVVGREEIRVPCCAGVSLFTVER
jgi:hypothetical protein